MAVRVPYSTWYTHFDGYRGPSREWQERQLRRLYKDKMNSPKWKMFFEDFQQHFIIEYGKTHAPDAPKWDSKYPNSWVDFFIDTYSSYIGFENVYNIVYTILIQKHQAKCFESMMIFLGQCSNSNLRWFFLKCYVCRKEKRNNIYRGMCRKCNPTYALLSWKQLSIRRKRCFESTFEFTLCLKRLGFHKDLISIFQRRVLDSWREKVWA